MEMGPKIALDEGLDLRQVQTTGSVLSLHISEVEDNLDGTEPGELPSSIFDTMGEPIKDFKSLSKKMTDIDSNGFVKKMLLEEGGGLPLGDDCTVFVALSAYWENDKEPFDVFTINKPLEVNLKDNGILPGLEMAIKTMLVGEMSLFLFSHEVMYGEMGVPPRIKPAAKSIFYIKLVKSILTPLKGKLNLSEANMFERVHTEVKLLYSSGSVLYNAMNLRLAINLFRKAVAMLHKCRLADEKEEQEQEKLLIKLYVNLMICYINTKQPLKACTACNELRRLENIWNNSKVLYLSAKALRMIGQYNTAEKRLRRAIKLSPESTQIKDELILLKGTRVKCNQSKLLNMKVDCDIELVGQNFKKTVDILIQSFKENNNLCKLTLPQALNSDEMDYVKQACVRENLFFHRIPQNAMVCSMGDEEASAESEEVLENFALAKEDEQSSCDLRNEESATSLDDEILRQLDLFTSSPHTLSME